MTREEKSKFEFEEKKFSLLLKREVCGRFWLETQLSVINWTFFPQIQILIFLRESTQNDHIRLLYKFENDQKNWLCWELWICASFCLKCVTFHTWIILQAAQFSSKLLWNQTTFISTSFLQLLKYKVGVVRRIQFNFVVLEMG